MPDYKETTITGAAWNRCHEILVQNVRGQAPAVRFTEERIIALDDGQEIRQNLGSLDVAYDPGRLIPILDPTTGLPTGDQTTYGAAYVVLYSAYIAAAMERDAAITPPAPPDAFGTTDQPTV